MRLRIYFKKINGILFQNALRKEQKQFIEGSILVERI
jgi:hypothetical protein